MAWREGTYPPAPFPTRKGGAYGFLTICISSCFDGFARMDRAIETQTPRITSRHSPLVSWKKGLILVLRPRIETRHLDARLGEGRSPLKAMTLYVR